MKIGFIGAGRMAQALSAGIARQYGDWTFVVNDPEDSAVELFSRSIGSDRCTRLGSNLAVAQHSDVLVLAVKPQLVDVALDDVHADRILPSKPLVISVAAGVSIERIHSLTGLNRISRVMPNTPCLIGEGASGVAFNVNCTEEDIGNVMGMMGAVGIAERVEESQLDAVTGLSGSGPAYVFTFIEAMIEGAIQQGLPPALAKRLATQTVIGAAKLVRESAQSPGELRERVTSPGGTTLAGLQALTDHQFEAAIRAAVAAATQRSIELA